MLKLDEDKRREIGARLSREVEESQNVIQSLRARWEKLYKIYLVDDTVSNLVIADGMSPYALPTLRTKLDRVIGNTVSGLTGAYPVWQALEDGTDDQSLQTVENTLDASQERAKLTDALKGAMLWGLLTNCGLVKVAPRDRDGYSLESDWIDPRMSCIYPNTDDWRDWKTVGEMFEKPKWWVEEMQTQGVYFDGNISPNPNADEEYVGMSGKTQLVAEQSYDDTEDEPIELWELISRIKIGKERKWYKCVIAKETETLLSIEEYPYERPWYFLIQFQRSEKKAYGNDSTANVVQGLCLNQNDMITTLTHGSYATAFPPVFFMGVGMNVKAKRYQVGSIYEIPDKGQFQALPLNFNPGAIPLVLERTDNMIDAALGLSRIGSGQQLPTDTKATAINAMLEADARAQDLYVAAASDAVREIGDTLLNYLRRDYDSMQGFLGTALTVEAEDLQRPIRLEPTGKTGAANPGIMLQKLQFLLELTQLPGSPIDIPKLVERIMNSMGLPFTPAGIYKDETTMMMQLAEQISQAGIDPRQVLVAGLEAMNGMAGQNIAPNGVGGMEGSPQGVGLPPQGGGLPVGEMPVGGSQGEPSPFGGVGLPPEQGAI